MNHIVPSYTQNIKLFLKIDQLRIIIAKLNRESGEELLFGLIL